MGIESSYGIHLCGTSYFSYFLQQNLSRTQFEEYIYIIFLLRNKKNESLTFFHIKPNHVSSELKDGSEKSMTCDGAPVRSKNASWIWPPEMA